MSLRVTEFRDITKEMTAALQKSGPIFESALDEAIYLHAKNFELEGNAFVHNETREPLAEWVVKYRESRPHCYADRPLEGEELEAAQIDDALLNPTPARLGALYKSLGKLRFEKLVADYGTDTVRMKGGTRPEYAKDGKTLKPRKANSDNPWSAASWNVSKQGAVVKALGLEKAAAIARAAGCKIGSTRPNKDFN